MSAEDLQMTPQDAGAEGTAVDELNSVAAEAPASSPVPASTPAPTISLAKKLPINSGNILLAVLVVVGIGFLYLLRLRNTPQTASAQEQTIEAQVESVLVQLDADRNLSSQTDDADDVIDTFYYEARQRQIPLGQLRGNPFIYVSPDESNRGLLGDPMGLSRGTKESRRRLEALNAVKSLELQSILMSEKGSTAVISNNIVRQGQRINGWTVKNIRPRAVLLTWRNQSYILKMPQ